MSYLEAAAVIVCASLAAALVSMALSRRFSAQQRHQHHEQISPVVQVVGLLFSVLLAFVFSEVWGEYNIAAQSINDECGALHGAAMLAAALPDHRGLALERALDTYVEAVIHDEWPSMARRERSLVASGDFSAAMRGAAALTLASPNQTPIVEGQIVNLLATAHAARETRTFQMNAGLPAPMWWVLTVMTLALVLWGSLTGMEGLAHVAFAAGFAACIVMVLVLVRMFDYPFEGSMALNCADFVKLAGEIKAQIIG
jgi:hypothetical protein